MNQVLRDIGQLSSGTIATLTGKRLYVEIDAIRCEFLSWAIGQVESGSKFETWQDAWIQFSG